MATEFSDENGNAVALRWYGGHSRGVVVELLEGTGRTSVTLDAELSGDDGSVETLRTLAENWSGRGSAHSVLLQREKCSHCGEADRTLGEHGRGRCVPMWL